MMKNIKDKFALMLITLTLALPSVACGPVAVQEHLATVALETLNKQILLSGWPTKPFYPNEWDCRRRLPGGRATRYPAHRCAHRRRIQQGHIRAMLLRWTASKPVRPWLQTRMPDYLVLPQRQSLSRPPVCCAASVIVQFRMRAAFWVMAARVYNPPTDG